MKQPLERTQVIILVSLFVLVAVLALAFFLGGREGRIKPPFEALLPATPAGPTTPAEKKKVILFFASENDDLLHPEDREIEAGPTPAQEAARVLEELILGSKGSYLSTLPPATKLRQVYITTDGTAIADFSKELSADHPSGTAAEMATVYAVVNSLTYNFKDVKKVFILIEGVEKETLCGHVNLNKALLPFLAMVAQ
jgi:spore germination protein GerM